MNRPLQSLLAPASNCCLSILLNPLALVVLTVVLALVLTATPRQVHAQSAEGLRAMQTEFGAFVNFNLNSHVVDFRQLSPDFPTCCPQFEEGSGASFNAGILYSWPWASNIGLQARVGVHSPSGELLREEATQVATRDGQLVDGTFAHTIDATLVSVGLEPLLEYQLFSGFSLYAGPMLAYRFQGTFLQQEEITQPDFGVFEDTQQRIRNPYGDDIPELNPLDLGVTVGLSYDLPLNSSRSMLLAPEILYTMSFTNVSENLDWKVNALRLGVAIKWVRASKPEASAPNRTPAPPNRDADNKPVAAGGAEISVSPGNNIPPSAAVQIAALQENEDGRVVESELASIQVEEILSGTMMPLLNYIFFDENSADLAARYANSTVKITPATQQEITLRSYHDILNVVGRRMQTYPSARLNILGCNSDTGPEQANTDLSRRRAQEVAEFLHENHDIKMSRLLREAQDLPPVPSNKESSDGQAENRRVELTSDNPGILAPLKKSDTLYRTSTPVIRLRPQAKTRRGVRSWSLSITQDGRELFRKSGGGPPDVFVDWRPSERGVNTLSAGDLQVQFEYRDKDGVEVVAPTQILPVELVTLQRKRDEGIEDSRIDRYSLILFDFGSAELGTRNNAILELIRERITDASTVRIAGYTDRSGDAEFNLNLSRQRAASTAQALGLDNSIARGFGESELLFNNVLPEGRFYCRTVEVEVETPIEE